MRDAPAYYGRVCNALLRWGLAAWVTAAVPVALAGETGIALRLDADWVIWIQAQRRAQGLDAPDAVADAQFQAMLQRLRSRGEPDLTNGAGRAVATEGGARCEASASRSAHELRAAEAFCASRAEVD